MPEIIYVSDKTIYKDIEDIQKEFGSEIIIALLAKIISENHWWAWPEIKTDIYKNLKP